MDRIDYINQAAKEHGMSYGRYKALMEEGVVPIPYIPENEPDPAEAANTRICRGCGKPFVAKHGSVRYHSDECRISYNKKLYEERRKMKNGQ